MNVALILKIAKYAGVVIAGLAIGWAIYAGIIRPTTKPQTTTKQEAEVIINHNYGMPKVSFGCLNMRIYERKKDDNKPISADSVIQPPL